MLVERKTNLNLFLLTSLTLVFLALNSLFCKAALSSNSIDPYSFTFFRVFFASLVLCAILYSSQKTININIKKDWLNSFFLFLYAICFSYSYLSLDAGLGALVLFAVVQITMIIFALFKKESLTFKKILGLFLAFAGLTFLLLPKDDFSISTFHFFLMAVSGLGWGLYSVFGKKSKNALEDTTNNFLKTIVFSLIFYLLFIDDIKITSYGLIWAFLSGGITSGIGYALWYYVLKDIKIVTASIIQLLVPIIAIFLSVLLLNEKLSFTLIFSTLLVLSGIFVALYKKV